MKTTSKTLLFHVMLLCHCMNASAQQVDSMYVNLYTDSLKKGTYNYINIEGLLSNGRYIPLDSSHVFFSSTEGYFRGNSLWIEPKTRAEKVYITITLGSNMAIKKTIEMYVKTKEDEDIITEKMLLERMERERKVKKKQ